MTIKPLSLDDKLLAHEHVGELLEALRDVADAYFAHRGAQRGRQREAALTRLVIEGGNVAKLLNTLNLRREEITK